MHAQVSVEPGRAPHAVSSSNPAPDRIMPVDVSAGLALALLLPRRAQRPASAVSASMQAGGATWPSHGPSSRVDHHGPGLRRRERSPWPAAPHDAERAFHGPPGWPPSPSRAPRRFPPPRSHPLRSCSSRPITGAGARPTRTRARSPRATPPRKLPARPGQRRRRHAARVERQRPAERRQGAGYPERGERARPGRGSPPGRRGGPGARGCQDRDCTVHVFRVGAGRGGRRGAARCAIVHPERGPAVEIRAALWARYPEKSV